MAESPHDSPAGNGKRRRRLRAVFAADAANFAGQVSANETKTLDALWTTRRIANEELTANGGWLFGLPGDGIFALFESAVDAVRCALHTQARIAAMPLPDALRLRIGVHLGEVLFRDELPFGEALVIAARLESLAQPGGILVSSSVMEAVAPRISATFSDLGMRQLKHIPRPIGTFAVSAPIEPDRVSVPASEPLKPIVATERTERAAPTVVAALAAPKAAARDLSAGPQGLALPERSPPAPSDAEDLMATGAACLAALTHALTIHLGPMAKVLVKRHAKIADPAALIAALVQEIPTEGERLEFIARAREAFRQPS
jgi:class 3 adenylate cyclase